MSISTFSTCVHYFYSMLLRSLFYLFLMTSDIYNMYASIIIIHASLRPYGQFRSQRWIFRPSLFRMVQESLPARIIVKHGFWYSMWIHTFYMFFSLGRWFFGCPVYQSGPGKDGFRIDVSMASQSSFSRSVPSASWSSYFIGAW